MEQNNNKDEECSVSETAKRAIRELAIELMDPDEFIDLVIKLHQSNAEFKIVRLHTEKPTKNENRTI